MSFSDRDISIAGIAVKTDFDDRLCLNDLHKAAGGEERHRPKYFISHKQTEELMAEILKGGIPPIKKQAGRYGGTYVCMELVYAYAMWVSPAFHLKVIRTFDSVSKGLNSLDNLVGNVRIAADSVKQHIDGTTATLEEMKQHGSNWSAYGHTIREAKREAVKQLQDLQDEIQMKLDLI